MAKNPLHPKRNSPFWRIHQPTVPGLRQPHLRLLVVDLLHNRATYGGVPIPGLTDRELRVLAHLVGMRGQPMHATTLAALAWQQHLAAGSRAVSVAIARLRAKLPPNTILTTKQGYRIKK